MKRSLLLALAFALGILPSGFGANALIHQRSRYLRQHASNPVHWLPWGDAALDKARRERKMIFLSIGYSTCHWCQVMEAESFSDPAIARMMNEHYVAILVDREERPDVDSAYVAAARNLMTDPGWPLNLILTPDAKPFFATSYIPKERLRSILERTAALWAEQREALSARAAMVLQALQPDPDASESGVDAETLSQAYRELAARYDATNGGFFPAPKFPSAHTIMFLLRYWRRTGNQTALEMAETTLLRMREGAIYDQTGFGFHRYSVDAAWKKPHYEKLLCDQALMAMAYLEAFQATGKPQFAGTAREIFTYALRELRAPEGAFYSAQDSDERYYAAADRTRLRTPDRDEKIIADWNGLMIAALASGAEVLEEPSYARAAEKAADFVLTRLRGRNGRLLHQTGAGGYLDDSAFLTWGLLNLYEATGKIRYLTRSMALQDEAIRLFGDDTGRFYLTAKGTERLPVRPRQTEDAEMPSGNSVELMDLTRLAHMTTKTEYKKTADALLRATAGAVALAPSDSTGFLSALDFILGPSFEIVLAGRDVQLLKRVVFTAFVPNKVVLYREADASPIVRIAEFTKEQKPIRGMPTAYVCTNFACKLPTTSPERVRALLRPTTATR